MDPNDPFSIYSVGPNVPGGLVGQGLFAFGLHQARTSGMINPDVMYTGNNNAYDAMLVNQMYTQQQSVIQQMAMRQANSFTDAFQGTMFMADQTVPPDLRNAISNIAGMAAPIATSLSTMTPMGRNILDITAGGVSAANIGLAMSNIGTHTIDPISGRLGMNAGSMAGISDYVASAMTQQVAGAFSPNLRRGFTGSELAQMMHGLQQRGRLPTANNAFNIVGDASVQRAMTRGDLTIEDVARAGTENNAYLSHLVDMGVISDSDLLDPAIMDAANLRQTYGIRSEEDLRNLRSSDNIGRLNALADLPNIARRRRAVDRDNNNISRLDTVMREQDAFAAAVTAPIDLASPEYRDIAAGVDGTSAAHRDAVSARRAANAHRALGDSEFKDFRSRDFTDMSDMSEEQFNRRLLEFAALTNSEGGFNDATLATSLSKGLIDARAGKGVDLASILGATTRQGQLDAVAAFTGQGAAYAQSAISSLSGQDLRILSAANDDVDPFNVVASAAQRLTATPDGDAAANAQLEANAREITKKLTNEAEKLRLITDFYADLGIDLAVDEAMDIGDRLLLDTGNQFGGALSAENVRRTSRILSSSRELGYTPEQIGMVGQVATGIAGRAGLERGYSAVTFEQLLEARQAFGAGGLNVDSFEGYGMITADQAAQQRAQISAYVVSSQEGQFAATARRLVNRFLNGKVDTDKAGGAGLSAFLNEAETGALGTAGIDYLSTGTNTRIDQLAGQLGVSSDYVRREMQNVMANERELTDVNFSAAVTQSAIQIGGGRRARDRIALALDPDLRELGIAGAGGARLRTELATSIDATLSAMKPGLFNEGKESTRNAAVGSDMVARARQLVNSNDAELASAARRFLDNASPRDAANIVAGVDDRVENAESLGQGLSTYYLQFGDAAAQASRAASARNYADNFIRANLSTPDKPLTAIAGAILDLSQGRRQGLDLVDLGGIATGTSLRGETRQELSALASGLMRQVDIESSRLGADASPASKERVRALQEEAAEVYEFLNSTSAAQEAAQEALQQQGSAPSTPGQAATPGTNALSQVITANNVTAEHGTFTIDQLVLNGNVIANKVSGQTTGRGGRSDVRGSS